VDMMLAPAQRMLEAITVHFNTDSQGLRLRRSASVSACPHVCGELITRTVVGESSDRFTLT
jgi:hypothetical protein